MSTPVQSDVAVATVNVVFVHGLFSGPEVWERFSRLLASDTELDVAVHRFAYGSPFVSGRPDRQVPEPDDIADHLGTYLGRFSETEAVMLVGHSQGGLIIQRYLSRALRAGRGRTLAPVKCVVTYACPNSGSTFFAPARRFVFRRHAQVRGLRVFNRDVLETQRHVLSAVVNTQERSEARYHIPFYTYGGTADRIVPARVARGPFSDGGALPGDHSAVVQPVSHDDECYRVLKQRLLAVTAEAAAPAEEPTTTPEPPASLPRQQAQEAARAGITVRFSPGKRRASRLQGKMHDDVIRGVLFPPPGRPNVHLLTGLGGCGKTRVAQEIAERAVQTRRVWWIQESEISAQMREVAKDLRVPDGETAAAFRGHRSSVDLVWEALEAAPEPWMLIFDNIDSPKSLGTRDGADTGGWIREPATSRGRVVVTSRDLAAADWLPPCVVHQVLPLPDNDGAALLLDRAPEGGTKEEARLLSGALGGLPLALSRAGAYVKSVRDAEFTVAESAISGFESYRKAIRARMDAPPGTDASVVDEMLGESIMAEVCGIALDLLAERGFPQAAPLLKVFACLNVAPIPYRLLIRSPQLPGSPLFPDFPDGRPEAVLRELSHLGLIEEVPLGGVRFEIERGLTLHPLVQGLLRGDRDIRDRRADYYGLNVRVLLNFAENYAPDGPENWDLWEAVLPHATEVATATLDAGRMVGDVGVLTDALELARLTARYLIAGGPLLPAAQLLDSLTDGCRSFGFERDDREILGLRHEQGRIHLELGDWSVAERDLAEVVAARERVLGPEDPDTLASRHKYARAVLEQSRWAEAAEVLQAVVEAETTLHGPEHSDTLAVRHSLARARFALREPGVEAELRDILAANLQYFSPQKPETLRVRQTLARCLLEAERAERGLDEIRQALQDIPQGSDDSVSALSLRFTYCKALLMRGLIPEALEETGCLVDDMERVLGHSHAETHRTLRLLEKIKSIPPEEESEGGSGVDAQG